MTATCNAIGKQMSWAESACNPVVIPLATITMTVCILELIAIISITMVSLSLKNKLQKQSVVSSQAKGHPLHVKLEVQENEAYATTLACHTKHNIDNL